MAKNEGKSKVDLGKVIELLDDAFQVNPELKKNFSGMSSSLKDIQKQGKSTELLPKARTIASQMMGKKTYRQLPEEVKIALKALAEEGAEIMIYMKQGKDGKSISPVPPSPKKNCADNQGIDAGPATTNVLNPIQSHQSPSTARKDKSEIVKLENEIKKLNDELEVERKKVTDYTHKLGDRLEQIKELEKEKDEKVKFYEQKASTLSESLETENLHRSNVEKDLKGKLEMIFNLEKRVNEYAAEHYQYETKIKEMEAANNKLHEEKTHFQHELVKLDKEKADVVQDVIKLDKEKAKSEKIANKNIEHLQGIIKENQRKHDDEYKKLLAERDDLRDRFSKLAGKKLQEQNADIADLSDPNRAMKLSEKFGQLYDDEWTNAFEYLTDKKGGLNLKEAINVLLRLLQECWTFCNNLIETQMESLKNVFLNPNQNPDKYVNPGKKGIEKPRVTSKDAQTLKDLRRRIGVSPAVIEEVKQALLMASKSWEKEKKGFEKKHTDACAPYLQKCAEICWLMALHDPALFMKMEVKQGEKLDPNVYTVYSVSGTTIDFLVWPPLYNGKDGGLLSKGVAEPLKIVSKKK